MRAETKSILGRCDHRPRQCSLCHTRIECSFICRGWNMCTGKSSALRPIA